MKPQKTRYESNYLLLGASLLLIGLLIQILRSKVLTLDIHVFFKTMIIMFMIAVGYSFAGDVIAPFAKGILKMLQNPFRYIAGNNAGPVLFYITIYALLFTAYLFIFVYGMKIPLI